MKSKTLLLVAILIPFSSAAFSQQQQQLGATVAGLTAGVGARQQLALSKTAIPAEPPAAVAAAEREAFDLLNAQRTAKGLAELLWNEQVAEIARHHSQNMARDNFFSHQDLDGLLVNDRADRAGLSDWSAIGENIAFIRGFKEPCEMAVENWMHSAGHRENLLSARWKESAVGVAIAPDGTYYFTQVFIVRNISR
jgi:uncharacterized protein YkwD